MTINVFTRLLKKLTSIFRRLEEPAGGMSWTRFSSSTLIKMFFH